MDLSWERFNKQYSQLSVHMVFAGENAIALGSNAVKKQYWLSIIFLILAALSFFPSYLSVAAALIFTFIVPGLLAFRFFSLKSYEIWAFVPVFSVLVSVQLIYYLSLLLGYSSRTIGLCFLLLAMLYTLIVYKKGESIKPRDIFRISQFKKVNLLLFIIIFVISLSILCTSVWRGNEYGIIITGSNWQDTPFHYDIIESLNSGNFPPQTPNYIGTPLTYHYFVDFHTAIVEKVYGYLPTALPVLNALFISVFAFAMYALSRHYGWRVSIISTVLGIFGWGLSYIGLFQAVLDGSFSVYQNYIYQFGQLFGLPSIFDNLLQQRPLLVGLPVFALVLTLLRDTTDKNRLLLAGVLTGLVFQFHNVAFFCCYVAFTSTLVFSFRKINKGYIYFLVPSIFALPFILSGDSSFSLSLSTAFIAQFAQNPLLYYILNLGIPLILTVVSFKKSGHEYLKLTFIFLFLIPNILLMTPWVWDMYKFFMFAWIPVSILSGVVLSKTKKMLAVVLILLSIITSVSIVLYNVGTEFTGVSWNEYQVGTWIRENTPEGSVFLTYYSIQCPPSMIAGRLRISSYVYWPYGHGEPLSEVNAREKAIDDAYNGTEAQLSQVIHQYKVSYVYVGNDELKNYPNCVGVFDSLNWLDRAYSENGLCVYRVDWSRIDTELP